MDIIAKEIEYQIKLEADEDIEILINGNSAFKETVPTGFGVDIYFKYKENKV